MDSIRARAREEMFVQVEEEVEDLWIRKRNIISAGIGSTVGVIIWAVLPGPTFH